MSKTKCVMAVLIALISLEVEVFAPLTVIMHADGSVEIAEWRNCSRR